MRVILRIPTDTLVRRNEWPARHSYPLYSSRAMISRWISLVPS